MHLMCEDDVREVLRHPTTMIGSDGIPTSAGKPHPRLYGTFPRVLGHYSRDQGVLGLEEGDAHVIRNAGGVVTEDEIRSLSISQRLLGTEEIILIHHTDCGMLTFHDDEFRQQVKNDTGIKPQWAAEAFDDVDEDVRQSIARIEASPFIPRKDSVRGFVYDVETGRLREVA